MFAASTLSRIDATRPVLDETWELWATIAERAFSSGKYDAEAEIRAHQELTGASVGNSYLVLSGRYQLALLGSRASELPRNLEDALVDWCGTETKASETSESRWQSFQLASRLECLTGPSRLLR